MTKLKSRSFEETLPTKKESESTYPIVSDILLRTNDRIAMEIEVEGMLYDERWYEEAWSLEDHTDTCYPDVKWREVPLTDVEVAAELTLSLLVILEHLIESRVQVTKKNIGC